MYVCVCLKQSHVHGKVSLRPRQPGQPHLRAENRRENHRPRGAQPEKCMAGAT